MRQLTGIDASFLYMETPSTFGHVSSLILFDPKDTPGAGYESTRAIFEHRLHLLDPMRRRLVQVPFNLDHAYWIEDPDLDLDLHIRQTAVPPPGNDQQLGELVSRLIARPLDRTRPLWELYIIYGIEGGLIGQLTKVHHAAIDGVGGAQLLMHILDVDPAARPGEPEPLPQPERVPSDLEMLRRGVSSLVTRPYAQGRLAIRMMRSVPQLTRGIDIGSVVASVAKALPEPVARLFGRGARHAEDDAPDLSRGGISAPPTPFNAKISPHRRFAFCSVPLDDVKAVKSALGVTVNDVVIGMCSAALRRYLLEKDALPVASLRAMIPVSVRTEDKNGDYGNRVSGMLASLCTDVDDPVKRLHEINKATLSAKETMGALPADLLTDAVEFAPPAITARAARVVARTQLANRLNPPFNLVISNVPGPQVPLYSGGAEMLHFYPVSAVADTQGLNITVQSYNGKLDFGLVACRELVPDLWDLCRMLPDALDELKVAAGV